MNNALQYKKLYVGNSEFIVAPDGSVKIKRTFITAPTGICAVYQDSLGVKTMHYVHTDHLGSWLALTSSTGQVKSRNSYDAWGRPRNPSTWELLPVDTASVLVSLNAMQPRFDRGYTGHEHMAGFGLINMNGRLYDPYLQRFLSPDQFIQDATDAQNFNRYTYCLNNPLMYTDPTGWQYLAAIEKYINPFYYSLLDAQKRGGGSGSSGFGVNCFETATCSSYGMAVSTLLASERGGTWSPNSGIHFFNDDDEAFIAGCMYNDLHNSWEHTDGGNFEAAITSYNGVISELTNVGNNHCAPPLPGGKFFFSEKLAYFYMWHNAVENEKEYGAIITPSGILVTPTYLNSSGSGDIFGYFKNYWKNGALFVEFNNNTLQVIGAIHTHQEKNGYYGLSYEDDGTTEYMKGLPHFVMNYDNTVYGEFWDGKSCAQMNLIVTRIGLINGFSLIKFIQTNEK